MQTPMQVGNTVHKISYFTYVSNLGGFVKHDPGATDGEDYDSEDERERKLLQLQEQLRQMQEQMKILVEESIRWVILQLD